jgi:hypothetical protein
VRSNLPDDFVHDEPVVLYRRRDGGPEWRRVYRDRLKQS